MTYDAQESSTESGQPVEFYLFEQSTGSEYWAYTSGTETVTHLGNTYTTETIKRSEPKLSPKSSSGSMTLTMPRDNIFVTRYLGPVPPLPDKLTVYRKHSTDAAAEVVVFWVGDVKAVSFTPTEAKIALTTLSERIAGVVPKRTFSFTCNHVLYDSLCQVGDTAHRSQVEVASINASDPTIVTVTDPTPNPYTTASSRTASDATYFDGGYALFTDTSGGGGIVSRSVVTYVDSSRVLTLSHRITQLEPGSLINIYAGCDHSVATCHAKFSNANNYGGFPFVPGHNPFSTGIIDESDDC